MTAPRENNKQRRWSQGLVAFAATALAACQAMPEGVPVTDDTLTEGEVGQSDLSAGDIGEVEEAFTTPAPNTHSKMVPTGYGCKWSDEFHGNIACNSTGCGVDTNVWSFQNVNVNNEKQEYTMRQCNNSSYTNSWNYCVRPAASGHAGVLKIRARNDYPASSVLANSYGWSNPTSGLSTKTTDGTGKVGGRQYSSGRLNSKPFSVNGVTKGKSDKLGYLEIAMKLPIGMGSGLWPSMFLLNDSIKEGPTSPGVTTTYYWPQAGELDQWEYVSGNGHFAGNAHWDNGGHRSFDPNVVNLYKDSGNWHVVGVRWQTDRLCWRSDRTNNYTETCKTDMSGQGEYNNKMHILLNMAVGGDLGGNISGVTWSNDISYMIDYVRWYQPNYTQVGFCGKTAVAPPTGWSTSAVGTYDETTEATCSDGFQNQAEEGVDCGGPCATQCGTCSDGVKNGSETNVDCGGSCKVCSGFNNIAAATYNQTGTGGCFGGACTLLSGFVDLDTGAGYRWSTVHGGANGGATSLYVTVASPSGSRSMSLWVNGINTGSVVTTSSATSIEKGPYSVTLAAGVNTVELRDTQGTTEFNVYNVRVLGASCTTNAQCNDNNACNGEESCSSGRCAVTDILNCDDGNVCTTDSCGAGTGCINKDTPSACSSSNSLCEGVNIDDSNICTDDRCEPATGTVIHQANRSPCATDNNANTEDVCSDEVCTHVTILACQSSADCNDNSVCTTDSCVSNKCSYANSGSCSTCTNTTMDGDETGVDCGGSCVPCASCTDGVQNQTETGIDCGGTCDACPTCSDGIQNQTEAGIDCGGTCGTTCPTCSDGIQNQDETGLDCGGSCANRCLSCSDGIANQDEVGIDCGGALCAPCFTPKPNMFRNAGFEDTTAWAFHCESNDCAGSTTRSTGYYDNNARIQVDGTEIYKYFNRVEQTRNTVVGGSYTISFDVETTGSNATSVELFMKRTGDGSTIAQSTCAVAGTGTTRCSFTGTVDVATTRFGIQLSPPYNGWDFTVDNASLTKN